MKRSMSKSSLLATTLLLGIGCYADESLAPSNARVSASVFLTDAPFPYDFVDSVKVYVVEVAASTQSGPDSAAANWVSIARPRKTFELLSLQQGKVATVGEGVVPPGDYRSIRMTIDSDSSSVTFSNGEQANVRWPTPVVILLSALVERPLDLSGPDAQIVIDFDVGRSFVYGLLDPLHDFAFTPVLRAVDGAASGTLSGSVHGDADDDGVPEPIENAAITVLSDDLGGSRIIATGHTGTNGNYTVGFLLGGTYIVQVEAPSFATLGSATAVDITISAGIETNHSVTLPRT